MTKFLFAVACENGSLFTFAGDKAIFTNRAAAVQAVVAADHENRKHCHCHHHTIVEYKLVPNKMIPDGWISRPAEPGFEKE